ncbi:MAG: FAD-dependent pyridine nucleotide-disulfide oxidoreductase [Clostridiales bacterium]|jgi:NAD(P)H-nitrite reductase large subunit|nr:FAD-dependent pyridine nucleotide-disulfide oxidoreductase [Clostridiales bacterium]
MAYVIIGNSAAAIGAVEGIRKVDRETPITLVSSEPYHTYSRPLISYYLAGKVEESLMVYRKKDFYEKNGVKAILGCRAEALDVEKKSVKLANGQKLPYEKLLIATGGKPFIPPIAGLDKKNVKTFIKLDDVKEIDALVSRGSKVIILGAGLIGLKAAEALAEIGAEVVVVELAEYILSSILDEDAAKIVQKHLENKGIKFELGTTIEKVLGDEEVRAVELKNGSTYTCDLTIVAIGVRPNLELVEGTPVTTEAGIVVNDSMETNIPGIYAAGDVTQGYDMTYGEKRVLPILPNAYKQGETAGINMAGGNAKWAEGFAFNSISFFGLPMTTAGIVNPREEGYQELEKCEPENNLYKKLVLKDGKLVGHISLNCIERSGILTSFIREKVDITNIAEKLLNENGLIVLEEELRHRKLVGGGAA